MVQAILGDPLGESENFIQCKRHKQEPKANMEPYQTANTSGIGESLELLACASVYFMFAQVKAIYILTSVK